jgi:hypothetical protein
MDLLGAALPNIMFIVGILAVGLGLGIELKVVSLNKEIDKKGRVGAFVAGIVLIAVSVMMYLNPSLADRTQEASVGAQQAVAAQAPNQAAATAAPPTEAPAPVQAAATAAPPTQTPAPIATEVATLTPVPTATVITVLVPDLHDKDDKAARDALTKAGLKPQKAETCTRADAVDPKAKKGRVQCQNPPAGQAVVAGTTVKYVLAKK